MKKIVNGQARRSLPPRKRTPRRSPRRRRRSIDRKEDEAEAEADDLRWTL
jgi:hypothetical protein